MQDEVGICKLREETKVQMRGLVMGHPSVFLPKQRAVGDGSGSGVTGLQAAGMEHETTKLKVEERDKVDKLFTMAQEQGVEVVVFAVQGKNKPVLTFLL